MISLRSIKGNFDKLRWWQKLSVIMVGIYLLFFLLKVLGVSLPFPKRKTENFEGDADNNLKCTMYYTTWCGYCKKAKPEWEKITAEFNDKLINGTKVLVTKVDCDQDPDAAKQAGVEGYPTFKFELNGEYIDFNGDRTYGDFKKYIETIVYASDN
jgi:thiol-disulfide isomerase/thioredoxin